MQRVDFCSRQALHSVESTRGIEVAAQAVLPPHTLMQRAGLAVCKLGLALAPHSTRIWVASGPGNNGGDGIEAAYHLKQRGKDVIVTWLGRPETASADALASYQAASAAGVEFASAPPDHFDLCIDALLGIGAKRNPEGQIAHWIERINASQQTVLAVDMPTGLQANTGVRADCSVKADQTLSLLTLKPGLFTAHGRDLAGTVWLDDLGVNSELVPDHTTMCPEAWLGGAPVTVERLHASHKGSYGDVAVIGGAPGMTGAALLAASAALYAGAGRVYVSLLDKDNVELATHQPELMFRSLSSLDPRAMTVVCGCGGGDPVRAELAGLLSSSARLVLDADALNHLARDSSLQSLLRARSQRHLPSVLTPHPLEAARLMQCSAGEVQADRLEAARQLAQRFACCVLLKGSGTVIADPGEPPVINPTGNPKLATAGSGDVLAGLIGAGLAGGLAPLQAACEAAYRHGLVADQWRRSRHPLTAGALAGSPQIRP